MTVHRILRVFIAYFWFSFCLTATYAETGDAVITLKPRGSADSRYLYVEELLQKALEKSGSDATVVQAAAEYSRDRLLRELIAGENIHVVAEAVKPGWVENLIPIRIPLRKGIQGYRLFLINRQDQEALSRIDSLEELKAFPTGSGSQWSTRIALEEAGFQVVSSEDYETLFKMLQLRRFLTFGRGINEAFQEQAHFSEANPELVVEQTLCIYIPLPTYFFVSPEYPELARRIEAGLYQMLEDGSFDIHFEEFYGEDIVLADLGARKIFKLDNPNLGPLEPIGQSDLWFSPSALLDLEDGNGG